MATKTLYTLPEYIRRLGRLVNSLGVIKKKVTHIEELKASSQNQELFRLRASRLIDPFPDELIIQERTISVVRRKPLVSALETIPLKDVGRVVYVNSILFGSLEVLGKNTAHDLSVKGLNKTEALKAKQIIDGLLLENQGDVTMPSWIQVEQHRNILTHVGLDPDNPQVQVRKSKI
jgi:hypothetical protein